MAAPIDRLIETLTETRAKLEEELGRVEAYRALRQLEQREATGERLSIVPADQLRLKLEAELAGNHYLNARRKLDEALELLGSWGKSDVIAADAPAEPHPSNAEAVQAAAPEVAPVVAEPAIPANMFPAAPAVPVSPPDDLSLIRDLPGACVSVVAAAGYGRYIALAGIDSRGVAMLERLLGQPGIVSRGNWIEQAAILATGRETRHAARLTASRTGAEWPPAPAEPELLAPIEITLPPEAPAADVPPAPAVDAPAVAAPAGPVEPESAIAFDPTLIRGIDPPLALRLAQAGVTAYSEIAQWNAADLDRLSQQLGIARAEISRAGWIEQAAMLASGRATRHLERAPVRAPLAPMPFEIVIAADIDPPAEAFEPEAAAAEVVAAVGDEPILIDAPANDTAPSADDPEASPFWAAAAGKAAVLRPVRRPADRTDKAFDDVAALVARTVATARNVGGMKERPKRPPAAQPRPAAGSVRTEAPARQTSPAASTFDATTTEVIIRTSTPAPPSSTPKPAAAPGPGLTRRHASIEDSQAAFGFDPEASIEIRPREPSAPAGKPAVEANGTPGKPRTASSEAALDPLARTLVTPRAPGSPRTPLAAQRPAADRPAKGNGRQTIVIDEINGRRSNGPIAGSELPLEPDLTSQHLGGLVGRFVKALRGDKAS